MVLGRPSRGCFLVGGQLSCRQFLWYNVNGNGDFNLDLS